MYVVTGADAVCFPNFLPLKELRCMACREERQAMVIV